MIFDGRPKWRKKKPLVTLLCVLAFLLPGIAMTTQAGIFIFELLDRFTSGFNAMIICVLELFAVIVLYGGSFSKF